ncbi:MAG TPA: tRNA preQ1(34) S-adenosylmethionine ribosyltransferase-isomerase QueA [Tepidisphaeraceae bacterium]|nr:tRNA preQ1(34) S-adenosylmethionine ribosyltransferase-isomerase QueA [Tepidisphaeraceae bacterium]
MRTDELDFHLPPELIAQVPAADRAASRLLHYDRNTRAIVHRTFSDLPSLLRKGDLLVFNNSRVIPARFLLRKNTGGKIEGLFLGESNGTWEVLLRDAGDAPIGAAFKFDAANITAAVAQRLGEGRWRLSVDANEPAWSLLDRIGRMPLPPYIKRDKTSDPRDEEDRRRYQTVYARSPGSVAAPTAGLHFTPELLSAIDAAGADRIFVTLHVGMGTFKPVTAERLEQHQMHEETFEISAPAAEKLNEAQSRGRRIIAVGTTSARVLESHAENQRWQSGGGATSIFIYPSYRWKYVDAMITNFHLPRSTLIALVAALVGIEEQRRIYAEAIAGRYRFFSYGDAMFVE